MKCRRRRTAAALEGLRYRDDLPAAWRPNGTTAPDLPPRLSVSAGRNPPRPYDPTNPQWQQWFDCARRYTASHVTSDVRRRSQSGRRRSAAARGRTGGGNHRQHRRIPSLEAGGIITLPTAHPFTSPFCNRIWPTPSMAISSPDNTANQLVLSVRPRRSTRTRITPAATSSPTPRPGTVAETGFLARLRRSNENFDSAIGGRLQRSDVAVPVRPRLDDGPFLGECERSDRGLRHHGAGDGDRGGREHHWGRPGDHGHDDSSGHVLVAGPADTVEWHSRRRTVWTDGDLLEQPEQSRQHDSGDRHARRQSDDRHHHVELCRRSRGRHRIPTRSKPASSGPIKRPS